MTDALALLARIEGDLATLRAMLTAPDAIDCEPTADEYLEPCVIADRLGLSEGYTRKLIRRGIAEGAPGFRKRGGRLLATVAAVRTVWTV